MKKIYSFFILIAATFAFANQVETQEKAKDVQPQEALKTCTESEAQVAQKSGEAPLTGEQVLNKFLREIFDAKTDKEQSDVWAKYKNYRNKFPREITAQDNNSGNIIKFIYDGEIFDCAPLEDFPQKISIPRRKTAIANLPSSYQIRYRFDADKDDELSDTEMFKLLIELHYLVQKSTTNREREVLIDRYANAIVTQDFTSELSINWGKNSTFKIEKDPVTGKWTAPGEAPIKRFVIGTHPSQTAFQEKLKDKTYAIAVLKILSRTNPFLRAEKIEELLKTELSLEDVNSKQALLINFVEYINEKSELVKIPIFKTDPTQTTKLLNDFSKINISNFSQEEIEEYKEYIREKQ